MFQLRQSILLFLTATIWGSGFVAQSVGMDHVTPFTYTFFRTFLGALFLVPFVYLIHQRHKRRAAKEAGAGSVSAPTQLQRAYTKDGRKDLLLGSFCCGLCLVGGESFQQFGLVSTDAGKAGFITSMYIIFVPILGLFFGKKLNARIVTGVVLSVVGLYLLCIKDGFTIERGDFLIFIGAIVFSFHIMTIDHFVQKCDGVYLSCGQFFAASLIALILMLICDYDVFSWDDVMAAGVAILWSGIMSNGVAYTLQVVGQRGMHPTIATVILSLESVMAVIFGVLLLGETLTMREFLGCVLILAAVLIAQINLKAILDYRAKRKEKAAAPATTTAQSAAPAPATVSSSDQH